MSGAATNPEFSVVVTCYFDEPSIVEFHAKLSAVLAGLGRSSEIIFVNDGSTDRTYDLLKALYSQDPRIEVVVDLFRNAGQLAAMTAGLTQARGRHFVFVDSDLQLDPADLPLLLARFDEGMDVVSGYRKDRKDALTRIIPSKVANVIMRRVSRSAFTDFGCTFKVFDGRLIRAFDYGPTRVFHPAHVIAQAQRCAEVPISHRARPYGRSGWTFRKLFAYNMDNLVSISDKPFQILSVICFLFGLLFIMRILLAWIVPVSLLETITNGLLLNFQIVELLLILAVLSAIGEFIIRVFNMLQRHPRYIVREILRRGPQADASRAP